MKRGFVTAATLMMSAALFSSSAFAEDVTKKLDVLPFDGIECVASCEVKVKTGASCSAELTCDSQIKDYVIVSVKNNVLHIDFNSKDMPSELKKVWKAKDSRIAQFKISVEMPYVKSIDFAGDAQFVSENATFDSSLLKLNLKDRARATGLTVNSKSFTMDISKNSYASLSTTSENFSVKSSNSANASVKASSKVVNVESSNSSLVTINGSAQTLKLNTSGSSTVDAVSMDAGEVTVKMDNSSQANVHTSGALNIEMKGNSHLYFKGSPVFNIVKIISSSVEPYSEKASR